MKFTIDGTTYELIQSKVTFAEARAIERVTGSTFAAITSDPELRNSTDVIQALIWVSMKRTQPTLTFSDIDNVEIDSIEWTKDDDDAAAPDPTQPAPSSNPDDGATEAEPTSAQPV